MKLRLGTRGSDLALWQARHVAALLGRAGHEVRILVLETRGDRIDDVPLQTLEGKGFFTTEIEAALLEERIDLAVHSHKDLPSAMTEGLVIAAVPPRAAPEERLLIAPAAHAPAGAFLPLVRGARVGTSAPRRTAQLAALRADLQLLALRGNVPTRVRRLREGRYDAIVLAAAGLDRLALDLSGLVVHTFARDELVPAPGQGALAVQTRARDLELRAVCAEVLADPEAASTVAAERALLVALGGGCNLPLGVALRREAERSWRVTAFLGAGVPLPEHPARWCQAHGPDPDAAVAAAGALLTAGRATGQGPLAGLRVALTGTRDSAAELSARLTTLGALVTREEALEIEDLPAPTLGARLAALARGDALVLTSSNAARRLRGLAPAPGVRVAAVGQASARALAEVGLVPELVGAAGAQALARALALAPGARVLFPCAESARAELETELGAHGVQVERLVLYRTRPREFEWQAEVDVRLYLSPSAVAAAGAHERARPGQARRLALGPSTAAALSAAGLAHECAASTDPEDVLALLARARPAPTRLESHA